MTDEPALAAITDRLAALAAEQGLDLEALGAATVRSAIRGRLRATHCDGAAYLQRIARDTDETGALLEDLLVPETWFFRDPPAFDLLRSAALAHGLTNGASTPFRVLSLACSTGEEVWSIAIALHEAGLLPRQMRVDALDLSRTAVARAQTAIYGSRSFRGPALVEKERYFVDLDNGRSEVNPALRASVRIATGNLLETRWERDYDAIFCRNVLIYMTYEAREQTISRASAALVPGGLLFVGHADAPSAAAAGFRRHPTAGAFAWIRQAPETSPVRATAPRTNPSHQPPITPKPATAPPRSSGEGLTVTLRSDALSAIRQLADSGQYATAERACREFLASRPRDPDALALLGLIAMATGRHDEAVRHLRQATYLEPSHVEGQALLSVLNVRDGMAPDDCAAAESSPETGA